MNRTKRSLKNTQVSLFFTVVRLLLGFWSRKIFLEFLGNDLVGLTATLNNILGFLNLAELGVSLAITAVLYEPLYNDDKNKIQDLIIILGSLFKRIAVTVFIFGLIISFFLPVIFKETNLDITYIFSCYYILLFSSLLGYVFNYKQTLIDADQKNYVITSIFSISQIFKLIFQILLLQYFHCSFYIWISLEFVSAIINTIALNIYTKKIYPWLRTSSYSEGSALIKQYPDVYLTLKKIIPHKFAGFVLTRTDDILIFSFVSLSMVAKYNNYYLIITTLSLFVATISNGIISVIGNLVSENNKVKTYAIFNEFLVLFYLLAGVLQISLMYLTNSFVEIWLGDNYILSPYVVGLFIVNFTITILRMPVTLFLHGHKLYNDTWAPWIEVIINLTISIVLGYYYGIIGVLLGTTVSLIIISLLWKPYFLFNKGLTLNVSFYWSKVMNLVCVIIAANILFYFIYTYILSSVSIDNFLGWIVQALNVVLVALILMSVLIYIFASKDALLLFKRITGVLRFRA